MRGTATVVGAGIAGLAAANALAAAGWDVAVHERGPRLSTAGTQLGVWPAAWRALEGLGVAERLAGLAQPVPRGRLLRPDGRVLVEFAPPGSLRMVPRMALLEALLAGLPAGTVRWSSPRGPGSPPPPADVVVAADGVHSATRALAFPRARLRDTGVVAFRGVAPLAAHDAAETWGRGLVFGQTPFPGGGTNWYAGVAADLAGPRDGDRRAVLDRLFGGWHAGVRAVLDAVPDGGVDRRRIEQAVPLRSFTAANTVLVGDAAHAMAPHLGRGGGEALADGLALAAALSGAESVGEGLARYDRARRRPAQRAVRASAAMSRLANRTRRPAVRDGLLAGAGALVRRRGG